MYPVSEVANLGEDRGPIAGLADLLVVVVPAHAHESLQPDPAVLGVDQGRARLSLI